MIYADTLTCEVTPNSVEPTSLSCSVPPLEWLDLWTMVGAWATVGATLVLAYFAWKAWKSSQETLKAMDVQVKTHTETAEKTLERQSLERYLAVLGELTASNNPLKLRGKYSAAFGGWRLGLATGGAHIALVHQVGSLLLEGILEQHSKLSRPQPSNKTQSGISETAEYYSAINMSAMFMDAVVEWRQGNNSVGEFTETLFTMRAMLAGSVSDASEHTDGSVTLYPNITNPRISDPTKGTVLRATRLPGPMAPSRSENSADSGRA